MPNKIKIPNFKNTFPRFSVILVARLNYGVYKHQIEEIVYLGQVENKSKLYCAFGGCIFQPESTELLEPVNNRF